MTKQRAIWHSLGRTVRRPFTLTRGSAPAYMLAFVLPASVSICGALQADAAGYPNAATLLRQSAVAVQRAPRTVHSWGTIATTGAQPQPHGLVRLQGDCTRSTSRTALRASVHGKMLFGEGPFVPLDIHIVLLAGTTPAQFRTWVRSSATKNTWQVGTRLTVPSRDTDLVAYLCPAFLGQQYARSSPPHLTNLGPVTVRGIAAWHLRSRLAPTMGGLKGTVMQSDFYIGQVSHGWLMFGSLYTTPTSGQRVSIDYRELSTPLIITAPTVGSSNP